MDDVVFQWDPKKAESNEKKHGVTFEEASTAFSDDHAALFQDPEHSDEEDRFILLGLSSRFRAIVVCHCQRCGGEIIRIISARKASKREERAYWSGRL